MSGVGRKNLPRKEMGSAQSIQTGEKRKMEKVGKGGRRKRGGDHTFLTGWYSSRPTHTLRPGHWAWASTPPWQELEDSPVWHHSTLFFFWSEK